MKDFKNVGMNHKTRERLQVARGEHDEFQRGRKGDLNLISDMKLLFRDYLKKSWENQDRIMRNFPKEYVQFLKQGYLMSDFDWKDSKIFYEFCEWFCENDPCLKNI